MNQLTNTYTRIINIVSLEDLIIKYPLQIFFFLIILMTAIFIVILCIYGNKMKTKQYKILQEKNRQLYEASLKEKKLRAESQVDSLTGLKNKKTIEKVCKKYIENHMPCALFMIDIDDFKKVNDTFGHQYGDVALKSVGKVLRKSCRKNDIAGRIGGDEFMILLKDVGDVSLICNRAEEIGRKIKELQFDLEDLRLTSSIGISIKEAEQQTYFTLLSHADKALYTAKSLGKSSYYLYHD